MLYNKSEIARKTGLSRQAVIKILNLKQKNPRIKSLQKIAKALNLPLFELIKSLEEQKGEESCGCI